MAGLHLDPWQAWCLDHALAEDDAHRWAAFEVAVIVGRQNGKGSVLEARQLAGLFLLHERLQVHTAHEFKTCFEHFLRMVALVESCPELDRRVARIRRGAGEQAIELKTGERLRFLARSSGSGRGMSGDAVYLDEAFALTPQMMGALLPTLSARPDPQVWYTSSAPMATSAVLHGVVRRGRQGDGDHLFYAEWGNDEGVDVEDIDAWYRANPALGIRISEEFVRSELAALADMPGEFCRERLGVPERPIVAREDVAKFPPGEWERCVVDEPPVPVAPGGVTIGFDVSRDGSVSSVVVGAGDVRAPFVELAAHDRGTGWLPAKIVDMVRRWRPVAVGCNGGGAAAAQVDAVQAALAEAGLDVTVEVLGMAAYKGACSAFYFDVIEDRLRRLAGQGPMDAAGTDATERALGDGWAWSSRSVSVSISPLVAATVARALLPTEAPAAPLPVFAY